jgi:uncharacterized protein (DUF58 family)
MTGRARDVTGSDVAAVVVGGGRPDLRLAAYCAAATVALVATLVTGRHELAAIGAPFVLLAVAGLTDRRPPKVRATVTLATDRALEGDEVLGEVNLDWEGEAELDVLLGPLPGVTPIDPAPVLGWALPSTRGPVSLPFTIRARAWGRHQLGELHVRARRPFGLVVWEDVVVEGPRLRVLPGPVHLDRLLHPSQPRAVAGVHLARLRGPGTDFADLRPYVPGDRLRDVAWAASARFGKPWVIVHHPERTGTLLLLLDASFDTSTASTEALARAARAAWAVAAEHLLAQDRVGLLTIGKTVAWLPPTAGRRARYLLLDELLSVGAVAEDWRAGRRPSGRTDVPPDALVVGVSTLRSFQFSRELLRHRRSGRTTAALVIDTSDLLYPPADGIQAAAQRLWRAELDVERHRLERSGIPTALVTGNAVAPAVSVLRRATARHRSVGNRIGALG